MLSATRTPDPTRSTTPQEPADADRDALPTESPNGLPGGVPEEADVSADVAQVAEIVDLGAARQRRKRVRLLRFGAVAVALAVLIPLTLRGRLPSLSSVWGAAQHAKWEWVLVACGLQAVSMAAFAAQQRSLLAALGVKMRFTRLVAISFARSAISISFPAGAAVSAGYALRQFRRGGASTELGTATMIVSGLVSIAGLAALYLGGLASVFAEDPAALLHTPLPVIVAVLAVVVVVVLLGRRKGRVPVRMVDETLHGVRAKLSALRVSALHAWHAGASLRARDWVASIAYALANWLTDLLCLASATRALGLPIPVTSLAGIYLGVQIVRQIPVTPGGVGLIETAFIAGLTAAGSSAASATAAVLIYRVISCWLLLPAGALSAYLLRRAKDRTPSMRPAAAPPAQRAA
jgi:uncharacterized protein (TIRG00374 family)